MKEFWETFYDAVREMFFSDKVYAFREIVDEPKTMREISEATGIPYVTVRKYMRWGYEKGVATVVGTKKERGAISEKWLLTFVPEVLEVEKNLILKVKLKLRLRDVFCRSVCPVNKECPTFAKISRGEQITPYRIVTIERRLTNAEDDAYGNCKE